jgi:uncharacterized membrane protein YdbT with pleckstrin-like domain
MGYINKHLMTGERIVYTAYLHGIIYAPPILVFVPFLVLCVAAPEDLSFILLLLALICCSLWAVNIQGGKQFVLTSRRVIVKEGIVMRKVNELMLRKCESIQVEQSVLGRLLGYGTLYVTTGEQTNCYKMIKDPVTFSTQINQQIEAQSESCNT